MKILVIGDGIIDQYCYVLIKRQSPENPNIPIGDFIEEEFRLGGAYNVAANLRTLSKPKDDIYVSSIMSRFTTNLLKEKNIFYDEVVLTSGEKSKPHSRELIKTRVIESEEQKQIIRIDNRLTFSKSDIQKYKNRCYFFNIKNFDAVVVSDYNKGIIDSDIIEMLTHESVRCPIFVDTKNQDIERWKQLQSKNIIFKVNQKEWGLIKDQEPQKRFKFVITNSEHGALYLTKDTQYGFLTEAVKNADVIGAGDIFLAGLVIKYLESNGDVHLSVEYANKAARKSVQKFGTCEVYRSEIL